MAYGDIRPFKSALGGHFVMRDGFLTAPAGTAVTQNFNFGEMVMVDDGGGVNLCPKDATEIDTADLDSGLLVGVAAWGPGAASTTADPSNSIKRDWRTGLAMTTGARISYYPANTGTLFITKNFWATGAGSADTILVTDVGESYQITYATFGTPDGGWGIEKTAAVPGTDVVAVIHAVLDARQNPIPFTDTTTAPIYLVFEITSYHG